MAAKTSDWRPGPSVCRCCFAEGCYKDISTEYFWMGKREVYSEMLTETFDVTIGYAQMGGPNSNSRLICEPCISRLRDASDFKRQVQECEKVFLQHLAQPGTSSLEYELPESSDKEQIKLESIKEEAKLDNDDDFDDQLGFPEDDDDDMDDEPLTKLARKVPKEESDEMLRTLLMDDSRKLEKRKSTTKVKESAAKKTKKKEAMKPSVSKAAPKVVVEKKKKGESETEIADDLPVVLADQLPDVIADEVAVVLADGDIVAVDDDNPVAVDDDDNYSLVSPDEPDELPVVLAGNDNVAVDGNDPLESPDEFDELPDKSDENGGKSKMSRRERMQNVQIILRFSTAYPFKLMKANTIVCVYCLDEFLDPDEFRKHMDDDHKNPNVSIAVTHTKSMMFVKVDCTNLRCKICQAPCETVEEFGVHLHDTHGFTTLNLEAPLRIHPHKLIADNWKCCLCTKKFASIYNLVKHTPTHFSKNTCEICGKHYVCNRSLTFHKKTAHSDDVVCKKCWKVFPSENEKSDHLKTSVRCRPFGCTLCGERFTRNIYKERHREEVHGESTTTYRCPDCPLIFNLRNKFYNHYRQVHEQKETFYCDVCNKSFLTKYKLRDHMNTHTLEHVYKCEVCKKKFMMKLQLKWHMRVHKKVKKIKVDPCMVCGQKFLTKIQSKMHMKVQHSGIKMLYE